MARLEAVTEKVHNGYYVDLFVRASNAVAIAMYTKVCESHGINETLVAAVSAGMQ